jgi:hypothetical protein
MSKFEFVETILSVADQQARSQEWYGDAHYSDREALEVSDTVKRNGREFTIKSFDETEDLKYMTWQQCTDILGDIALFSKDQTPPTAGEMLDDDLCLDTAFYLDSDDNFYYFEGNDRDFIYEVPRCKLPENFKKRSIMDMLSATSGTAYDVNRDMSDYEMDVLL